MNTLERRIALIAGPLAVVLWIAGLAVGSAAPTKLVSHASDAHVLAWVQGNKNPIIVGAFLYGADQAFKPFVRNVLLGQ